MGKQPILFGGFFDSLKSDFIKPLKWFGDLMGLEVIYIEKCFFFLHTVYCTLRYTFSTFILFRTNLDRQPNINIQSSVFFPYKWLQQQQQK